MHGLTWLRVTIGVVVLETLALAHLWLASGPVLVSEPNSDKQLIAQVAMTRDFPYLSVQAYLEVRASGTGALRQRYFLLARDEFQDLAKEVRSLEWRGDSIMLDIDSAHYSGPTLFQVP